MKTDNTFKDLPPLRRRAFIGQMFAAAGFVGSGLQQTRAAEKKANEPYLVLYLHTLRSGVFSNPKFGSPGWKRF